MSLSVVGIDVGTSAIRAVEIEAGLRPTVLRLGQVATPPGSVRSGEVIDPERVASATSRLLTSIGVSTRTARLVLNGSRTLVRPFSIPAVGSDAIEAAVLDAVRDRMPLPVEDLYSGYTIDDSTSLSTGETVYLGMFAAAHRRVTDRTVSAIQLADMAVSAVELAPFVLARIAAAASSTGRSEAVVSLGGGAATVVVHRGGVVHAAQTIPIGGADLTTRIAQRMSISMEAAEHLKRHLASAPPADTTDAQWAIGPLLGNLVSSIARVVQEANSKIGSPVEVVLLTGGGSRLHALGEQIELTLGISAKPLDPFVGLTLGTTGMSPAQINAISPLLASAVGAALGVVDPIAIDILKSDRSVGASGAPASAEETSMESVSWGFDDQRSSTEPVNIGTKSAARPPHVDIERTLAQAASTNRPEYPADPARPAHPNRDEIGAEVSQRPQTDDGAATLGLNAADVRALASNTVTRPDAVGEREAPSSSSSDLPGTMAAPGVEVLQPHRPSPTRNGVGAIPNPGALVESTASSSPSLPDAPPPPSIFEPPNIASSASASVPTRETSQPSPAIQHAEASAPTQTAGADRPDTSEPVAGASPEGPNHTPVGTAAGHLGGATDDRIATFSDDDFIELGEFFEGQARGDVDESRAFAALKASMTTSGSPVLRSDHQAGSTTPVSESGPQPTQSRPRSAPGGSGAGSAPQTTTDASDAHLSVPSMLGRAAKRRWRALVAALLITSLILGLPLWLLSRRSADERDAIGTLSQRRSSLEDQIADFGERVPRQPSQALLDEWKVRQTFVGHVAQVATDAMGDSVTLEALDVVVDATELDVNDPQRPKPGESPRLQALVTAPTEAEGTAWVKELQDLGIVLDDPVIEASRADNGDIALDVTIDVDSDAVTEEFWTLGGDR
ncbi:MAG: type IV pilus assembly protein PilM [Actinobacteria bacterium]|nr:type IV pilus assembly protein PilM [Actinomycetota bacterium]